MIARSKRGIPNTKRDKNPINPPQLISIFLSIDGAPASPVTPPIRKRMAAVMDNQDSSSRKIAKNWIKLPPNPPITIAAVLHLDITESSSSSLADVKWTGVNRNQFTREKNNNSSR
jgi:hypothetical protein